jgi:hypothetical protein
MVPRAADDAARFLAALGSLAICAHLRPTATDLHHAPATAAGGTAVVVHPPACMGITGFETFPGPIALRNGDLRGGGRDQSVCAGETGKRFEVGGPLTIDPQNDRGPEDLNVIRRNSTIVELGP